MKTIIKRCLTSIVLGSLFWLSFVCFPPFVFSAVLLGILISILLTEWRNLFNIHTLYFWLIMPFYPVLPFLLLIYMNHHPLYHNVLLFLFILVSSYDMGGYLVGTRYGIHKIVPQISPGKSWEGFFGGYLFALIGLMMLLWEQHINVSYPFILGFALIVCVLAFFGDLFESWLKRRAHIKDSGTVLPGHGGFLDRFDGILCAVFFFYIFRDILVTLFSS